MNALLTQSCYQVAVTVLIIRTSISTGLYFACPNHTEIFDKSNVYGYKDGNTHYFCLQAKFTNDYLCSKTPASDYPVPNSNGHLFFIHPTWKTGQTPSGCNAQCRLFNPLAPFKSDEPKLLPFDNSKDALQMCGDNDKITTSFSVPNKTFCNCTEDNCRESYIGFKIDTSSIATQVVRYSYSISKLLCFISNGAFATTEEQTGMNASANQPGVTDCPPQCDCTHCPICCPHNAGCPECPDPCKEVRVNNESVSDALNITEECDDVITCKTIRKSSIYWFGPDGILISSSLESTEHSLQLSNLTFNGTYQCIYNKTDYCGNVESSSSDVYITVLPFLVWVNQTEVDVYYPKNVTLSCHTNDYCDIKWHYPNGSIISESKRSMENTVQISFDNLQIGGYECTARYEKCFGHFDNKSAITKLDIIDLNPSVNAASVNLSEPSKVNVICSVDRAANISWFSPKNENISFGINTIQLILQLQIEDSSSNGIYTCEISHKSFTTREFVLITFNDVPIVRAGFPFWIIIVILAISFLVLCAILLFLFVKKKKSTGLLRDYKKEFIKIFVEKCECLFISEVTEKDEIQVKQYAQEILNRTFEEIYPKQIVRVFLEEYLKKNTVKNHSITLDFLSPKVEEILLDPVRHQFQKTEDIFNVIHGN